MFTATGHFPRAAILMVERHVQRGKLQPEQAGGAGKGGFDHPVQLQVGFQLCLIQIMVCLAAFGGVIVPIPCLQIAVQTVGVQHVLQHLCILFRAGFSGRPDRLQQLLHPLRGFGHFGFQFVAGKIRIAQQLRTLFAQLQDLCRNGAVVVVIAVCPA